MEIEVLFEDNDIIAINKPPGVVVNRAASAPGKTIQDWMEERYSFRKTAESGELSQDKSWWSLVPESFDSSYGEPEQVFLERSGMVHRLDKDTSGVLLLAKNPGALLALMAEFQQRTVQKTYHCLVHGLFAQDSDTIRLPVGRSSFNRQRFAVVAEGRAAETFFKVQERYQLNIDALMQTIGDVGGEKLQREWKQKLRVYEGFSFVECEPKTGRTHQIRVHMSHLQHPLVGDKLYVGKKRIKLDELWCPRHFLHAAKVTFLHPRTQETVTVTAPLSPDLTQALTYLLPSM